VTEFGIDPRAKGKMFSVEDLTSIKGKSCPTAVIDEVAIGSDLFVAKRIESDIAAETLAIKIPPFDKKSASPPSLKASVDRFIASSDDPDKESEWVKSLVDSKRVFGSEWASVDEATSLKDAQPPMTDASNIVERLREIDEFIEEANPNPDQMADIFTYIESIMDRLEGIASIDEIGIEIPESGTW